MKQTLTVIILTYNERLHIRRCLEKLQPLGAKEIVIVDCHSTDGTQTIAQSLGARVIEHDWPGNQAAQMKWLQENVSLESDWVLRLDADEYLLPELIDELKERLDTLPLTTTGVVFKRRHIFMGKWVKHGVYPVEILRLWRNGKAVCEQREMDEHMILLEGESVTFKHDFVDHNLNNLIWWTQKHLNYARREIRTALGAESAERTCEQGSPETVLCSLFTAHSSEAKTLPSDISHLTSDIQMPPSAGYLADNTAAKRHVKSIYYKLPLFWRSFAYFLYRYFIKLGFLDGQPGFLWAYLQAFWYRTFVDALIYERRLMDQSDSDYIKSRGGE